MQRTLILLAIVWISTLTVSAQISLGLGAGLNAPMLHWKTPILDADYRPGLGPDLSALLEWQAAPSLSVRLATGWGMWRNRQSLTISGSNGQEVKGTNIESYQRLQGALTLLLAPLPQKNIYLSAGMAYSNILSGRYRLRASGEAAIEKNTGSISLEERAINRQQWLVDVGAGYRWPTGRGRAFAEIRYQIHLNDFSDLPLVESRLDALVLQVGYQIPITK